MRVRSIVHYVMQVFPAAAPMGHSRAVAIFRSGLLQLDRLPARPCLFFMLRRPPLSTAHASLVRHVWLTRLLGCRAALHASFRYRGQNILKPPPKKKENNNLNKQSNINAQRTARRSSLNQTTASVPQPVISMAALAS